ncbi:MAG TPA: hypothetical protein PKI20_19920 [Verrucomicrobiota bacterium]|nr:hypothetical protein [Verrucomicrobiota bacterium]HQL80046.1 hypothetical protein [Verrucomicrobiota bacterium]
MKTSKEMKELLDLVESHRGLKDERLRLAKLKAEHLRVKSEIGDADISDPRVQKQMADATLGLALVEARLARLGVDSGTFDKIDALHRLEGKRYNEAVNAAESAAFEALVKSQLPFFDGDEAACREYWRRVRPPHPMFHKFERARCVHPSGPRGERDVASEVSAFLARRERYSKLIGLD